MSKWKDIKSLPDNTLVLLGVWVQHIQQPKPHQEFYIASYDPEDNILRDQGYEASLPWGKDEFDGWMPIPELKPQGDL